MDAQRRNSKARRARSPYRAACIAAAALATIAASPAARAADRDERQVSLGGQYRINAYSAQNDLAPDEDAQSASRVRIRQNVDVRFDERFKTHVQFELGHTTGNMGTTSKDLRVRHAVLDFSPATALNVQAGIVPLGDHFGDVLFSSDWDYNPVAVALDAPLGPTKIRAFAGVLGETDENVSADDVTHYQVDVTIPVGEKAQLNAGATFLRVPATVALELRSRSHLNYGAGARVNLARDLAVNAFVLGSQTDSAIAAAADDAKGVAAKVELTGKVGPGSFGVLATHATGEEDGSGFLPVQALVGHNGYWGYTGILTIQGPTDTGFDGDSVNISNNGYGMTSLQARYVTPIAGNLSGYLAAGWFGNSKATPGRSGDVGVDVLVMATYRFNRVLALDVGGAFAQIKDSASGYPNRVDATAGDFSNGAGTTRKKNAVVARIQAEF